MQFDRPTGNHTPTAAKCNSRPLTAMIANIEKKLS